MKQLIVYFFKTKVLTSTYKRKTFQVSDVQIRLLKRFERSTLEKYLLSLYHKKGNF